MRAKGNTEEARTLNSYLDAIRLKINQTELQLQYQGTTLTLSNFKEAYSGKKEKARTIIPIFQNHNDKVKELIGIDYAKATHTRYETTLAHIQKFLNWKYQKDDLDILEIDNIFINDLDFYLRTEHKCANNTVMKYIKNFKKNNPHMPSQRMDHHRSIHQLQIQVHPNRENPPQPRRARPTYSQDPNQRTTNTRTRHLPIRLLHRTSLHRHQTTNHQKHSQRHRWPKLDKHTQTKNRRPLQHPTVRSRTKHLVQIPRPSKRQSRKHAAPHSQQPKMNAYLKEIADLCGINKILTFHCARHTFATTVTLSNGVPIESVSKMLGHKSIKTTQHYAKITDRKVSNDMENLKKILKETGKTNRKTNN